MIVVIAPTRGRPRQAAEMIESFRATTDLLSTELVLVVDEDDPELAGYRALPGQFMRPAGAHPLAPPDPVRVMVLRRSETGSLVKATNSAASRIWDDDVVIGHVGDDHRFRTSGWDRIVVASLARPGIAYANDGHWGERRATMALVSSVIPRTLGWYALPVCRHNGWDNAVVDLGREVGVLHYLPDVLIEHPSPAFRRTSTDPGYRRARAVQAEDRKAYLAWRRTSLATDAAKLRHVLTRAA